MAGSHDKTEGTANSLLGNTLGSRGNGRYKVGNVDERIKMWALTLTIPPLICIKLLDAKMGGKF